MASFLSPGVKVTEISKGPVAFTNIPTAIGGFLVEAQKGPANVATLVTSLAEAQEIFGARYTTGVLEDTLSAFFNNGGASCYVVRAVSATAATASRQLTTPGAATAGSLSSNTGVFPVILAAGDTFTGKVDGGAAVPVTITATSAQLTGVGGTFLAGGAGDSIGITVSNVLGGATQTVDLSAVTAGVANYEAALNAGLVGVSCVVNGGQLRLVSDQKGTGAVVTIVSTGGAAAAKTGFTTTTSASGTGSVANIAAVTAAELASIFNANFTGSTTTVNVNGSITWTSNTTGALSSVQFTAGTGVAKIGGFDNVVHSGSTTGPSNTVLAAAASPGAWGNTNCQIKATRVDTTVTQTAVNAAGTVSVLDVASVARLAVGDTVSVTKSGNTQRAVVSQIIPSLNRLVLATSITIPVGGYSTSDNVVLETFTLAAYTAAQAVIASFSNLRMSSLAGANYFVNKINNTYNTPFTVTNNSSAAADPRPSTDAAPVAMTGGSDGATLTSSDWIGTQAASTGIYAFDQAADVNFISVPGITSTANQVGGSSALSVLVPKALETYVTNRADVLAILDAPQGSTTTTVKTYVESTANLASSYEAVYWPWVKALNPSTGYLDSYPPSAFIQGIIGRTHQAANIGQTPAGTTFGNLAGVLDVDTRIALNSAAYDAIYPSNINAIMPLAGNGVCVMGSRTLDPAGTFGQISVRIVFNTLKRILRDQLLFVLFQNNNDTTRATVVRIITAFLRGWRAAGIIAGNTDAESFFVICDTTNNTPSVIASGKMVVRVGIAPQRPTEFLDITIEQDTRAAEAAAASQSV